MTLNISATFTAAGTGGKYIGQAGTGVMTLNDSSSVSLGNQIVYVGSQAGTGTLNVNNSATFTAAGEMCVVGTATNVLGTGGSGTINVVGGTVTVGSLTISRGNNNTYVAPGTMSVTGGVMTSIGAVTVGFAGNGNQGTLNVADSTFNVGTTVATQMVRGAYTRQRGRWTSTADAKS